MAVDAHTALPALRQELSLQPAPPAIDGSPTWTLHDPADNRFFQIGWAGFEMLSRWSLGDAEAVARAVSAETTLAVDAAEVEALAQFLMAHHLVLTASPEGTRFLHESAARRRLGAGMWLLKNYLFVRFPLVRPMPFLRRVYPWIRGVYSPRFWWLVLAVTLVGLYRVSQQWDTFVHTFHAYTTWQGLLGLALALSFAKVVHELGHAFTAYRYGCRIPTMGFGLLVMWPVLYTDTNEAWKLSSRRQRLHIGIAGMAAELTVAAFSTLLWNFLPPGPLRAGVFMLATSTWVVTLTINATPFTRFDGYFVLSDWLNMPNMHERTFAIGRWWLRERLFGFGDPVPEPLPRRRLRLLVLLAWVTWLYRFILFLSISLLVFHFFFRALGMVLMCVEIGWFLVLPIVRELRVWWQRRADLHWCRQTVRSTLLLAVTLALVLVPWQASVHAPAVLGEAVAQRIYVPHDGRLTRLAVRPGEQVRAGQVLARLRSPGLAYRLQRARAQAKLLAWQVRQQPFDDALQAMGPALKKQLAATREDIRSYRAQIARLTLRAPFAGRVAEVNPAVQPGTWLAAGTRLLQLVAAGRVRGDAFIGEDDVARVHAGQAVAFVAGSGPTRRCRVSAVDRVNLATLDQPYVASVYGGDIPSVRAHGGALTPLQPVYRVRFDGCGSTPALPRQRPGHVVIAGARHSLAGAGMRWLGALFRRQATF